MKDIRQHIKNVLVEETENKKVKLAKQMIYDLFDEVSHVEQSKFKNKPLLYVYFDSDKPAVNIEPVFDKLISKTIMEYTGDYVVVCPYWAKKLDYYETADIYISSLKSKNELVDVIKEETQNKEVKLVKQMIYNLFDEVSSIKVSEYDGKPLLNIYIDSDDPAANIEAWFDELISEKIMEYTGGNIIVLPDWTFHWDPRLKNVDVYINTILLKYDEYGNVMNESKILQENEEDPTQKILNFLSRRYKVEDIDLGWEGNPIKFKTIKFDVYGEKYGFTTFENKREQIRKIVDMLIIYNIIEPIDPYERQLDPYTQKVIKAVKLFINQVM